MPVFLVIQRRQNLFVSNNLSAIVEKLWTKTQQNPPIITSLISKQGYFNVSVSCVLAIKEADAAKLM